MLRDGVRLDADDLPSRGLHRRAVAGRLLVLLDGGLVDDGSGALKGERDKRKIRRGELEKREGEEDLVEKKKEKNPKTEVKKEKEKAKASNISFYSPTATWSYLGNTHP